MFFKAKLDLFLNKTELFIDGKRIENVTSFKICQDAQNCPEITITFIPKKAEIDFNTGGIKPKEKTFKIIGDKIEGLKPRLKPIPKKKKPIVKEKIITEEFYDIPGDIPF